MHIEFVLLLISALLLPMKQLPAGGRKTVWNGVYTDAQAARGQALYEENCMGCHRSSSANINPESRLSGTNFMERWREDNVEGFFSLIKATMPRRNPGSLSDATYVDIVAHLLRSNSFPAGREELTVDNLAKVQIEERDGPKPLPSGALVQFVGCLTQDGRTWVINNASEPARTRRSVGSTATELEAAQAKALGAQAFGLQNVDYLSQSLGPEFSIESHLGHKMQAKGYLIRQPTRPRIDVTSLEMIGSSCAQ